MWSSRWVLRRAVNVRGDGDVGLDAALGGEGGGGVFSQVGVAAGGVLSTLTGCLPVSGGGCH